jgi:hypothetical protein
MKVGDLVWYYSPYRFSKSLCVIVEEELRGIVFIIYEFETGEKRCISKSAIKKLDKL